MPEKPKRPSKDEQPKSFETALTRLEEIAAQLEDGSLALDEALALSEEGMKLSDYCEKQLTEAQGKVEQLIERMGAAATEPFAATQEDEE
jgi:exodeoxyribonuclease VII small subunit